MASLVVLPNGTVTVNIPVSEKVSLYSRGQATLYKSVPLVNHPNGLELVTRFVNGQYTSAVLSASVVTPIVIEAGAFPVYYEIGVTPSVKEIYSNQYQPDPVAVDVTGAISALAIVGGIVTSAAAAVDGTVPTGAVMDLSGTWDIGDSVDWSVIKVGANAFTVTAAASGHTLVGSGVVATATSGHFRTRKTAADTFVTYRMS